MPEQERGDPAGPGQRRCPGGGVQRHARTRPGRARSPGRTAGRASRRHRGGGDLLDDEQHQEDERESRRRAGAATGRALGGRHVRRSEGADEQGDGDQHRDGAGGRPDQEIVLARRERAGRVRRAAGTAPPITSSAAPASALCGSPTIRQRARRSTPPARKKAEAMASTTMLGRARLTAPEDSGRRGVAAWLSAVAVGPQQADEECRLRERDRGRLRASSCVPITTEIGCVVQR